MRNLNYAALVTGNAQWMDLMNQFEQVKSDCLRPCALVFRSNLMRTANFAMLPAELTFSNRRDALFQSNALFVATGKGVSTIDELLSTDLTDEILSEFRRQGDELSKVGIERQKYYRGVLGVNIVERFSQTVPEMQSSMDAIFVSIVLESWLFFEAFVGDLWVASVDNAVKSISNRLGVFNQWANPEEKITPDEALTMEYDAKTHPGSFLREAGKVTFTKLRSIKKFYGAAFGKEAERIFEEVDGGRINVLSGVRNCIIHSAGKIDKDFRRLLEQTPRFPELAQFKDKSKIELTGDFVSTLRNAAVETGLALLRHADTALQSGG